MAAVVTDACLANVLRLMRAQLSGLTLRLVQTAFTPAFNLRYNDVQECDFPGYVGVKMVGWSAVYMTLDDLRAETDLPIFRFVSGALATPLQTVYGYMVTDSSYRIWWSDVLDTPVLLDHVPQQIEVQPYVVLGRA